MLQSPILPKMACGISLKPCHYEEILETRPAIDFLELHAENYMDIGGAHLDFLQEIGRHYPLSLHGVGMSLGTAGPVDETHLDKLVVLVDRLQPVIVSEHAAWSRFGNQYLNDLLPVPMTDEGAANLAANIDRVQQALGRVILVENASSYFAYQGTDMSEPDFLSMVADRAGCQLLLDLTNVQISAHNIGFCVFEYLDALATDKVAELHLAGFAVNPAGPDHSVHIDSHDRAINETSWDLFNHFIGTFGSRPTLIERDNNIPSLGDLLGEGAQAKCMISRYMQSIHSRSAL